MGFLPKIGSIYSSFSALKLDVLERAHPFGLNFTTSNSLADAFIDFRCCGRRRSLGVCSCRVSAHKTATGSIQVVRVVTVHNCTSSSRRRYRAGLRFSTAGKIQKLRREVPVAERRRMRQIREAESSRGENDQEEGDSQEDSASEEEVAEPQRQLRVRTVLKSMREVSENENEEEETENENSSETESEALVSTVQKRKDSLVCRQKPEDVAGRTESGMRLYPRADQVQAEIQELLSNGVVSFPTFEDRFGTPRDLLIRLYAHAQQRGFSVHRRSGSDLTNQFRVSCHRSHKGYENKVGGTCPFKVTATEGNDGVWRLLRVEAHNHEVKEPIINQIGMSQSDSQSSKGARLPRKRRRQSSSPSPPPSLSARPDTFPVPSYPYRPRLNATRPPARRLKPSTPSSNPSDLSLLVKSFLPPSSPRLSATLYTLKSLGISNVEMLTSMLSMGKDGFERFVGKIEGVETRRLLKSMADDLRGTL